MRKAIAATTLAAGLIVTPVLDAAHAQTDTAEEGDDDSNLGWLGLIGLAGLAGLAGLKRRDRVDTRTDLDTTAGRVR